MRNKRHPEVHLPGRLARWMELLRGRNQMLVRPAAGYPLLLLSFRRGDEAAAEEVAGVYTHLLPSLPETVLGPYRAALQALPAIVVVILRPHNACGCLGHHHPPGTESRLARRLAGDLGSAPAEIDLAVEAIRCWEPQPLSSLAVGDLGGQFPRLHFAAALLAVMLHELDHLAFPDKKEREVRVNSNAFYDAAMRALIAAERGGAYGMWGR